MRTSVERGAYLLACPSVARGAIIGPCQLGWGLAGSGRAGLGGLGVGGMGQAAAVSPVISLQTANRRVISVLGEFVRSSQHTDQITVVRG